MYLNEIIDHKREEIKGLRSLERTRSRDIILPIPSLTEHPFIAEIKKASPSMGDIAMGIDIIHQAQLYEHGGAGAISVLTDRKYFKGDLDFLTMISDNLSLPILCKDFILSEIQIENAYQAGADFILLIAAVLTEEELKHLSNEAYRRGLTVLYEIHEFEEFKKIRKLEPEIVGVNSRDLRTFTLDKDKACTILRQLKGSFLKIAESGIETAKDIRSFQEAGADAYLVGTTLMRSVDPVKKLQEFNKAVG